MQDTCGVWNSLGRWLNPDPLRNLVDWLEKEEDRSLVLQPYVYVANNPVNLVDPSGLIWGVIACGCAFCIIAGLGVLNGAVDICHATGIFHGSPRFETCVGREAKRIWDSSMASYKAIVLASCGLCVGGAAIAICAKSSIPGCVALGKKLFGS